MPDLFPFMPDWSNPVEVEFGMYTDLYISDSGKEMRKAIRTIPWQRLTFTLHAMDSKESAAQDAMIRTGMAGQWLVPMWHHQVILATTLALGAVSIPVSTAGRFFTVGNALLWRDWEDWEIVNVTLVNPASLDVDPTTREWPTGTLVVPVMTGVMKESLSMDRETSETGMGDVSFDLITVVTYGITE